MSPTVDARRRWPQRLLRTALWLALGWLALSNLALNLGSAEAALSRQPERFRMQWSRALSLWPGRILLWDVTMQGQTRRNAWEIRAGRVSGRIALWPLLRKELRVAWLEGETPRIAISHAETDLEPRPAADHGLRLVFEDLRINSSLEFTHGDLVLTGNAQAQARWSQQLRRGRFELEPSLLRLEQARLRRGEHVFLEAGALSLRADIAAHRRSEHPGLAMLDFVTLDLALDARGPGAELALDANLDPQHRLLPGEGHIAGRVAIERGRIADATALEIRAPVGFSSQTGLQAMGEARLALETRGEDLALALSLPPIPELVQRLEADLRLAGRALPLPPWAQQRHRIGGTLDLDSRFSSLDLVQPLLSRLHDFSLDGRGEVQARLRLEAGQLAGDSEIALRGAQFDVSAFRHRFRGTGHAQARLEPGTGDSALAQAQVTLERFDLAPASAPEARLGSGRNLTLDFRADGGDLLTLRDRLDVRLRFSDAALPDLTGFNRYLPRHGVQFLRGTGLLGADLRMQVGEDRSGGRLQLAARNASLRFSDMVLRGDVDLDARLAGASLREHRFALPGTRVAIRRAAIVEPADDRLQDWWATLHLDRGEVHLSEPLQARAHVTVEMRDVAPLLSMYGRRRQFPRWITRVVDAGRTQAATELEALGERLTLDHIQARNARFEVLGRLRLGATPPSGQLYARWGALGAALELDQGARKLHLAGARKWFDRQPSFLPPR